MKTVTLRFRCSEDEAAQMRQRAAEANSTLSEWIRGALCKPSLFVDVRPPATTDRPIAPEHQAVIDNHTQQTVRQFRPYSKAQQTGRKPK